MAKKTLSPTDPPILLAGLIAARKTGDRLLADVFRRELEQRGITVRFADTPARKTEEPHGIPAK